MIMAKYTDGSTEIEVEDNNPSLHILERLGWQRVEGTESPDNVDEGDELPEEGEETADSYDEWSNEELRTELKERGLSTTGKKEELIARLEEDDEKA